MNAADIAVARREELARLFTVHGTVTPAQVVAYARDPGTALHSYFEWDDSKAGEEYRKVQAAQFIRAVCTVLPTGNGGEPPRIRAYVSLPEDRGTQGFRAVSDVLADPERREALLQQARKEYQSFRVKYKYLEQLSDFFAAADAAMDRSITRTAV